MTTRATLRFLLSALIGLGFFLLPVPSGGRLTVPFDIAVGLITDGFPRAVGVYCLVLILGGAAASIAAAVLQRRDRRPTPAERSSRSGSPSAAAGPPPASPDPGGAAERTSGDGPDPARPAGGRGPGPDDVVWLERFRTGTPSLAARVLGAPLALIFFFRTGPALLLDPAVAGLMWDTLAFSVGVIIPIGAGVLLLFVRYGVLEFIGTLMRPVMRPLFRLPGRSALDSVTSWVGSYSVGLYLTQRLFRDGYYDRRETYIIVTCFSTVSIGFVAVVAQTLDLLHLFPLLFACYFLSVYLLTAILARTWPAARVPTTYLGTPRPEPRPTKGDAHILARAWRRAIDRAEGGTGMIRTLRDGALDGLGLAATILGSILSIGTAGLLLARETPLFQWLGAPLVPVLDLLGIPDAATVAPAVLVGITEMYIPALLVVDAAEPARFFVAVLSVSQLIFFSALAPMVLDMFRRVPVRTHELIALFLLRTAILLPLLSATVAILRIARIL